MKQKRNLAFLVMIAAFVAGIATLLTLQRHHSIALREELKTARFEAAALAELVAENTRLKQKQIPIEELERLRADRAALPRLRAELEALQESDSSTPPAASPR
jgi:hypothetical protein